MSAESSASRARSFNAKCIVQARRTHGTTTILKLGSATTRPSSVSTPWCPSVFMLMLCLIPAIMSAIAVVREKETGSIANFRSTPITKFEFLIGKQMPYVAVAMINFSCAVPDGDLHLRRSDQGAVPHPAHRHARLRVRHDRVWAVDLFVRAHPGGGGVRHGNSVDRSGRQLFRLVRAGVVPVGDREDPRPDPSPRPGISR